MRRKIIWLVPMLALVAPAAAFALREADGTLSVSRGSGTISVVFTHGSVLGRFDKGKLVVEDSDLSDGVSPIVYGADKVSKGAGTTTTYSGINIRFRIVGGAFKLRLVGAGIDLSAVGRGSAALGPDSSSEYPLFGTYSYNGSSDTLLPLSTTKFVLGSSSGS